METLLDKKGSLRVIDLMKWGESCFEKNNFENPKQEIEWLLCDLLESKRADIYVNFEESVSREKLLVLNQWIIKRLNKMPLQYITGKTEFYGNLFFLNQEVLIPRPETERLVDIALDVINEMTNPKILEIGTGSGCISISLAEKRKDLQITALDISQSALDKAIENSQFHKIYNIDFKHLDILKEIPYGEYDVIISNPPYIGLHELNNLMSDVKDFEPLIALTDNKDGLSFYSRISSIAPMLLRKNGFVILEVGLGEHPNQAYEIFKKNGYKNINLIKDFNNDKRVLKANI